MGAPRSIAAAVLLALGLGLGCTCGSKTSSSTAAAAGKSARKRPVPVPPEEQKPFPTNAAGLPVGIDPPPAERPIVAVVPSSSVAMYGTFYGRSKDPKRTAAIEEAAARSTGAEVLDAQVEWAKDCAGCHGENGKGHSGVPDLTKRRLDVAPAMVKKILIGPHGDRPKAAREPTEAEVRGMTIALQAITRGQGR